MPDPYIEIGEVLRPHGVMGLVKVRPDTEDAERFLALDHVFVQAEGRYVRQPVSEIAVHGDGYVYLRLNGAETRDEAEKQRGRFLYVDRANARKLPEGEWFICDLKGCEVRDTLGTHLGVLTDVLSPGANHVFVVKTGKGNMLVAAMKFVIVSVDVEQKLIVLDEKRLPEVAVYE
ncbi:MAG: 16S rRNA processing protein RimM [Clostridia bacterium]|nr:16S rRNA processing protein RimM [Clostridia bacterium]